MCLGGCSLILGSKVSKKLLTDTQSHISPGIPALPVMRLLSTGYIFYFRKRNSMFIKRLGRFPRLWQLGNHVIH